VVEAGVRDPRHPGPEAASIPAAMVQQLIDHARAEYPNESCGLIIGDRPASEGGTALRFEPARNKSTSPYRYEIHPDDLLRLTIKTDDADEAFWGIVHSHTHTPARPSPTDLGLALYPEALYIVVSLSEGEAEPAEAIPSIRAWRIVDGDMFEVEVQVTV
jgi:[CysO sulfur-carrier protein]-S-L-cysteine hydrolase